MIIGLTLERDKQTKKILANQALYQPSEDVKLRTGQVLKDFQQAVTVRNKPYAEFGFMSLTDRMNIDQQSWNQYPGQRSQDPAESWKSLAFRPIVRNKIISIAAHITAAVIFPMVYAQNDRDEEDQDAAAVMRDLMEWVAEQSKYDRSFVYAVIGALVNPATILHTEFVEHFREVKRVKPDGGWDIKKELDEIFSGFQTCIVPCDELYIADIYEHDVQRQPLVIWRKVIDYSTAKVKYGDNKIFSEYVKPGIQFLYSDEQNLFYEQWDDELQGRLVEEVIYYNRQADLRLVFINGILIDDPDQPNPREDKLYPFSKTGYELIDDGRFFYYKSLAFKLAPDEEVVNTLYRLVIDGSYIQVMPPAVVFGNEEIGSSVIVPGAITTIDNSLNPQASFQTIATNNNLSAGLSTLQLVTESINESSADVLQSGMPAAGSQTAFEIAKLDQNARVMLGLFGKMIAYMVRDYGQLVIGDILQFLTVGDAAHMLSDGGRLKFRTFLLPERTVDGKSKTKRIEFDMEMPDEMTETEMLDRSFGIMEQEQEIDDKSKLIKVNPALFRKLKFKVKVVPEAMTPKSDAMKKALMLEEYALAMANPLVDQESVTRDLLLGAFDATKDDPEKYMRREEAAPIAPAPSQTPTQVGRAEEGRPDLSQMASML